MDKRCEFWKYASINRELINFKVKKQTDFITVISKYYLNNNVNILCTMEYNIYGDGKVKIKEFLNIKKTLSEIPEFGVMIELNEKFSNIKWYGRGPHENYWDRKKSAKIGLYEGKVKDQYVNYLKPQECGNKTDVRWSKITNDNGIGISVESYNLFDFNALNYTPFELQENDHYYKLLKPSKTVLRINYAQMGVGGDDSWGAKIHSDFILYSNRNYMFEFLIKPIF
jgi:beta-galactosidase